jgi:geranylgeranyl diphosphate synthase, type II
MNIDASSAAGPATAIDGFCAACRRTVLAEIRHVLRAHRRDPEELGELVLDYPLRPAKGLRPALCIAAARALGATEQAVLASAAALELLHNAFLIHDDVEDESLFRRGEPTLQRAHGLPIAVNVADGMFALALLALLDNLELVGLRASLAIYREVAEMLWTTVGGQARELGWIRANTWRFDDHRAAYEELVTRKTAIYSFVVPTRVACIAASAPAEVAGELAVFARHAGIAFQIADDLLNLRDDVAGYGKEALGDLWEGKRTLMLLHALHAERDPAVVQGAVAILERPRPGPDPEARQDGRREAKTLADVRAIAALIERHDGAGYARGVALEHVRAAEHALARCRGALAAGDARDFLFALPAYVVERLR